MSSLKRAIKTRRIAAKLTLSFAVVALVPLLVAAYVTYRITEASAKRDVLNNLLAVTHSRAKNIETYALERRRNVTTLSQDPAIVGAIERYGRAFKTGGINSAQYSAVDRELRPFLTYYKESAGYTDLFLISPEGDVIFSVNKGEDLGTNYVTGPYMSSEFSKVFDRAKTLLETEISDFEYYPVASEPAAFIAAPVLKGQRLIGLVAFRLSNEEIYDLVRDYTGLGQTGETIIASMRQNKAVFMAPVRHDPDAAFKRNIGIGSEVGLPVQEAVRARKGFGLSVDYRGKIVLAAWRYLPSFRWGMVVKMDAQEAFAPITNLRNWWLSLGIMAAVMVVSFALFFARSISLPLARLTRMTERIAGGDLTTKVEIDSLDEVGQLANAFNTMTTHLKQSRDKLENEITRRTQTEHKLRQTMAELMRSNAELNQFAYVASHDLQEPLRAVVGCLQLLQQRYGCQLDESADELITHAVDGGSRMQSLIDDLLAYSRVGAHGKPLEPTDCSTILDEALANLKAGAEESSAVITHDPLPILVGDVSQLVQLFQNLIGNAIKFRSDKSPEIHIGAKRQDRGWLFSVQDNGIGIDPHHAERIFVIFQRLHTRAEYPGTGIGLAICKKIVEHNGGRIWVKSEPEEGSTFYFTVPDRGGELS